MNRLLERNDIKVNLKDKRGPTPLSCVAREDIEVNSEGTRGRTPLSYAARYGHEAIVNMLLGCDDIEVNFKDTRTPLLYCCEIWT